MPKSRSYAILGTGALGGFYGARLARAGTDVHFLLRSDFEQLKFLDARAAKATSSAS